MPNRLPGGAGLVITVFLCGLAACSEDAPAPTPGERASETSAEPAEIAGAPPPVPPSSGAPAAEPPPAEPERASRPEAASESEPDATAPSGRATTSEPQTHIVNALVTAFEPIVLFMQPGDTVRWTNMTGHDTQSIDGMIPEGAKEWQSPAHRSRRRSAPESTTRSCPCRHPRQ